MELYYIYFDYDCCIFAINNDHDIRMPAAAQDLYNSPDCTIPAPFLCQKTFSYNYFILVVSKRLLTSSYPPPTQCDPIRCTLASHWQGHSHSPCSQDMQSRQVWSSVEHQQNALLSHVLNQISVHKRFRAL